jgi:ComF family protein
VDNPGLCHHCSRKKPSFKALRSWAKYDGPVSEAIRQFKYGRDMSMGFILAEFLTEILYQEGWPVDIVVPVPLGVARFQERGYNQAALIAKPLALKAGLPYDNQALTRVRETRSQVGLTFDQRLVNVKDAFRANQNLVKDLQVLVIDDVTTSSATIDACSAALRSAGARGVYGLTLARAI